MISVIIPTLNAEESLSSTFASLVTPTVTGLVREVIVTDGGSQDATAKLAEAAGATFLNAPRGRGQQLRAGADAAKSGWLLFLHADTTLDHNWHEEVSRLINAAEAGHPQRGVPSDGRFAACFQFALDDFTAKARILERVVALRCRLLKLPYGDQGLLINRKYYEELGGFRQMELMEDVDLVRRVGARRIVLLNTRAVTSADRYRRDGFFKRPLRNALVMTLYLLRVPPKVLARLYG